MKFVALVTVLCLMGNARLSSADDIQSFVELVERVWKWYVKQADFMDPLIGSNITEFLDNYYYPWEAHDVTTEDGYILTLHRISQRKHEHVQENATRPAVLLVHCLACSAMDWVWQGPNNSLALLLADLDYDVWLANTRGNVHSVRHQTLTPANASFWDFSFHEKGYYDAAAVIDYILDTTGLDKLTFVGHSQGATAGLVLTSSRPEYNDKLNLMVLMAPIVYLEYMSSPLVKSVMEYQTVIKEVLNLLNIHGFRFSSFLSLLQQIICCMYSMFKGYCMAFIAEFAGIDLEQIDIAKFPLFLTNTPSGLSVRDVEHYLQGVTSGAFRQYDYGSAITNLLHYGVSEPPAYDIGKVTAPLALYYAKNDYIANVTDVKKLISQLSHDTVDRYLVEYELFNHLDFITAMDVKTMLYDRVIKVINQVNSVNPN